MFSESYTSFVFLFFSFFLFLKMPRAFDFIFILLFFTWIDCLLWTSQWWSEQREQLHLCARRFWARLSRHDADDVPDWLGWIILGCWWSRPMMEDPLAQLHKRNSNRSEKLEDDRIFELLILAFFFKWIPCRWLHVLFEYGALVSLANRPT